LEVPYLDATANVYLSVSGFGAFMKNPLGSVLFGQPAQPGKGKQTNEAAAKDGYTPCHKSWLTEVMQPSGPNGRVADGLFRNTHSGWALQKQLPPLW
jgi:hypothetical protein